jgi:hypothetical protein
VRRATAVTLTEATKHHHTIATEVKNKKEKGDEGGTTAGRSLRKERRVRRDVETVQRACTTTEREVGE